MNGPETKIETEVNIFWREPSPWEPKDAIKHRICETILILLPAPSVEPHSQILSVVIAQKAN
jgi:hypothetical protein